MPITQLPAINQNIASGWTENQRDLYNFMPYWLANMQVKRKEYFATWSKLTGRIKWQPNMGEILKAVRKEPSPVMRQHAFPNELSAAPVKDVMDVREMVATASLKHHDFESPIFNFYPSFRDFMKDHVQVHGEDITDKQIIFNDMFIRSVVFHNSPFMYLCNKADGEVINAPVGNGSNDGSTGKTTAFLQAQMPLVGNPGNLSLLSINLATTIFAEDIGQPAWAGGTNNENASKSGLQDKYLLVTSAEAYNQFTFDPWMLAHKSVDLNVITQGFKGDLFGRVTCRLERYPLRMAADGTFPAPEIRVIGDAKNGTANASDPYNTNESIPNPAYVSAPFEFAFLCGQQGYDSIEVGPPPKEFANNGMPEGFGKMQWNGELVLTKNILIQAKDADGNLVYDTNAYGKFLKFISECVYGCLPRQRRAVLPIMFKRRRGSNV